MYPICISPQTSFHRIMPEDEHRFPSLLEKHKGILLKAARMYMDTEEDRKYLQQEIIIQLRKPYRSFKAESEFSTWMYRVAINFIG